MKLTKNICISHWNIKRLHDPIFSCKFQSTDFINSLKINDINILTETWGCSHDISIPNFESKFIKPNKLKSKKTGRSSGGIVILFKKYLKSKTEVIKKHSNYIWL